MIEEEEALVESKDELERYLTGLRERYRVSTVFLNAVVPRIREIFSFDIPSEQRKALLGLAEKSFKLQAETEAILCEACEMVGYLRPYGPVRAVSRRRPPVSCKTVAIGQSRAPGKARFAV